MANLITPLGLNFNEASPFVSFDSFTAEDYTIEIWFNTSESAGNLVQSGNSRLSLWVNSRGLNSGHVSSKSNKWESIYKEKPDSPIVHMATTYDNASGTKTMYINGEQIQTETIGATESPLAEFGLGAWSNDPNWKFTGTMYQARVWNVVRSAAEIKLNWLTKLTGNEAGLLGYYNMDSADATAAAGADGYPTTVKNHASASNNGTLSGFGSTNPWNQPPADTEWETIISEAYGYDNGRFSSLTASDSSSTTDVYTKSGEFTMTRNTSGTTQTVSGVSLDAGEILIDIQAIPEATFAAVKVSAPENGTYIYRCQYELIGGNYTSGTITTSSRKIIGNKAYGGYGYLPSALSPSVLSVEGGIEKLSMNDQIIFRIGLKNLTNTKVKMKLQIKKI